MLEWPPRDREGLTVKVSDRSIAALGKRTIVKRLQGRVAFRLKAAAPAQPAIGSFGSASADKRTVTTLIAEWAEILAAAAVAAPSADNQHVFRLHVRGARLTLHATDDLLRAPSTRRVLGLLSIGAVAENVMLRGRRLGLLHEHEWWPGDDRSVVVRLVCQPSKTVEDPLEQVIEARHTNRRLLYRGPALDAADQEQLSGEAMSTEGGRLVWLDDRSTRPRALRLVREAEAERFSNPQLHRELFDSIRFDAGWHVSTPQGLPPGSLSLPWLERGVFGLLRNWRVQRVANLLGTHHFMAFRAADLPCRLAPHLCAVTATGEIDKAAVAAGRLLQRVWLRATRLGLACQVFAASPLYALEGSTSVRIDLQRHLAQGWNALCPQSRPFVVIRMGRARPPEIRAGRHAPMSVMS